MEYKHPQNEPDQKLKWSDILSAPGWRYLPIAKPQTVEVARLVVNLSESFLLGRWVTLSNLDSGHILNKLPLDYCHRPRSLKVCILLKERCTFLCPKIWGTTTVKSVDIACLFFGPLPNGIVHRSQIPCANITISSHSQRMQPPFLF